MAAPAKLHVRRATLLAVALCAAASAGAAPLSAFCSEGAGWEMLPELDAGLPDVPDEVLNATLAKLEEVSSADVNSNATAQLARWEPCPAEDLNILAEGCLQEGEGILAYWLRLNLTCAREEGEASVTFEAAVAVDLNGIMEVLISALAVLDDASLTRVCQDPHCEACAPVPVGSGNASFAAGLGERCFACAADWHLEQPGGQCKQDPGVMMTMAEFPSCRPGCSTCDFAPGAGYYLNQLCTACQVGYSLQYGDCAPVPACNLGSYFDVTTGLCEECRPGCDACRRCRSLEDGCLDWQYCTSCDATHYFFSGYCYPCSHMPGCAECQRCVPDRPCYNDMVCNACAAGYTNVDGRCIQCRTGCAACQLCAPGSEGCFAGQRCTQCDRSAGFVPWGGNCIQECGARAYYDLTTSTCTPCSDPRLACTECRNCLPSDGQACLGGYVCTKCRMPYSISGDGRAVCVEKWRRGAAAVRIQGWRRGAARAPVRRAPVRNAIIG